MDNPKVFIKKIKEMGSGVFAQQPIKKGEVIASFDGRFYRSDSRYWNRDLENHVIHCGVSLWRDSDGIARLINHSCEPNCGIKQMFDIVVMRSIQKGEEITWDYDMTENTRNWRMWCKCGTPSCRKIIGAYRYLPESFRKKYRGYISSWLLKATKKK